MAEPPTKGQPPNNGQNARPHRVHYSEVPLYILTTELIIYIHVYGSVVVPMVHPMGSQCTTWYRWDGTDMWDSVGQWWYPWSIPWDPSVPHGTDGMGRTCGTVWVSGGAHGTSHGIPVYHTVQMGWDGHVGQCGSVVVHPGVPHVHVIEHGSTQYNVS